MKRKFIASLAVAAAALSCTSQPEGPQLTLSGLDPDRFVSDGEIPTALYTLTNASGMEVCVTNFGGRIVSIMVPDRDGVMRDVVLGFDNVDSYINVPSDFGASIGRYANRINQGRFTLDGKEYQLPLNNYGHCLHGGPMGWQYQVYEVENVSQNEITLVRRSPDGDQNFPGNVTARTTYTLTDDNCIDIRYSAETDAPTIINMTNHSYFNLSGDASTTILDHELTLAADMYTPVDDTYMTTGEVLPVADTPMDFTSAKPIGAQVDDFSFEQLRNGNGYDHNWVLRTAGDDTAVCAELYCPRSGIVLQVLTDEPGIQVYSGNFLDSTAIGKNGIAYQQRSAVCLETQHYPDSPNKADWPSVVLRPGEVYSSHCVFRFSAR